MRGSALAGYGSAPMIHFILGVTFEVAEMEIKEAVQKAAKYLPQVFENAANTELRLEGVEKTDDGNFWKITFSYPEKEGLIESFAREYKTVKLRDSNGELMGAQNGMLLTAI